MLLKIHLIRMRGAAQYTLQRRELTSTTEFKWIAVALSCFLQNVGTIIQALTSCCGRLLISMKQLAFRRLKSDWILIYLFANRQNLRIRQALSSSKSNEYTSSLLVSISKIMSSTSKWDHLKLHQSIFCHVFCRSHSVLKPWENYPTAVPLSSTERFSIIQLIV